jgi:MFS family permease
MTQLSGEARVQLGILSLAIVLGMAPWFAATVVAEPMARDLGLTTRATTWLTLAVQLGFVLGSVASASLLLSDRLSARRLAASSALLAAAATGLLAVPGLGGTGAVILRLVAGASLAGVYPPGIKLAAGWTQSRRGTAIGILVGALTLGTGVPHLVRLVADLAQWRPVLLWVAACTGASAIIFWRFAREGPHQTTSPAFEPRAIGRVLGERGVLLATGGYLGHMWELYAMWSSIGLFTTELVRVHGRSPLVAPLLAFAVIGVAGGVGCVAAGVWADRIGKARVTILAMAISACCALSIGPALGTSFLLSTVIALVWGVAIIADSAQFSACVTLLAPPRYVGTAVTMQIALGFLLTMLSIRLVPAWVDAWGWSSAYAPLAIGPAIGILFMWRLWVVRRI